MLSWWIKGGHTFLIILPMRRSVPCSKSLLSIAIITPQNQYFQYNKVLLHSFCGKGVAQLDGSAPGSVMKLQAMCQPGMQSVIRRPYLVSTMACSHDRKAHDSFWLIIPFLVGIGAEWPFHLYTGQDGVFLGHTVV